MQFVQSNYQLILSAIFGTVITGFVTFRTAPVKEESKPSPAAPKARKSSRTCQTRDKGTSATPQPKAKALAPAKKAQPPPRSRTIKDGGPGVPPAKGTNASTPAKTQERLSIAEMAVQAGKQAALASAEKKAAKVIAFAYIRSEAEFAPSRLF